MSRKPSHVLRAGHVIALLRGRLRACPDKADTMIAVAGPGGLYDIVNVVIANGEIVLEITKRKR